VREKSTTSHLWCLSGLRLLVGCVRESFSVIEDSLIGRLPTTLDNSSIQALTSTTTTVTKQQCGTMGYVTT